MNEQLHLSRTPLPEFSFASYTKEVGEKTARDPNRDRWFVMQRYGAAGAEDRYDEGLRALGLHQGDIGATLAVVDAFGFQALDHPEQNVMLSQEIDGTSTLELCGDYGRPPLLDQLRLAQNPRAELIQRAELSSKVALAKRAALILSVMDTRSDGLQSVHLYNMELGVLENTKVEDSSSIDYERTAKKLIAGWLHDAAVEDHAKEFLALFGRDNSSANGGLARLLRKLPNNKFTETYLKYADAKRTRTLALTAMAEIFSPDAADLVGKLSNPIPIVDNPWLKSWLYKRHIKGDVSKDDDALELKGYDMGHNAGQNHRTAVGVKQLKGDIKYVTAIPPLYRAMTRRGLSHLADTMRAAQIDCKRRIGRYKEYRKNNPESPSIKMIIRLGGKALDPYKALFSPDTTTVAQPRKGEEVSRLSQEQVDIAFKYMSERSLRDLDIHSYDWDSLLSGDQDSDTTS